MNTGNQEAALTPIESQDVPEVAAFLHQHMNNKFSVQEWQRGVSASWLESAPNYGFMLRTPQSVVGVICALYSEQEIDREVRLLCNPHTWCVLEPYRKKSVSLVLAVIRQKDMHYSMYSPNSEGEEIFAYLGFKPLSREMKALINIPTPILFRNITVKSDLEISTEVMSSKDKRCFEDHSKFPWLNFLSYEYGGKQGFIIYKKTQFKRLPCANLIYVSDKNLLQQCWGAVRTVLLVRHGFFTTKAEQRLLDCNLPLSFAIAPGSAKFYLSDVLQPDAFDYTYSELVAMDL